MKKYIDTYKFDGDWEFYLKLPKLSGIYDDYWFRHQGKNEIFSNLEKGYVPFQIVDERNYEPDPTEAQENAIDFLIGNEDFVTESIFKIFKHDINEKYVEWSGEDEWLPVLNTYKDLGKLARINSIQVLPDKKNQHSYVRIDFEYLGDEEHGVALILHKERLIGFSGIGDLSYECIYTDAGLDGNKIFEEILKTRHIGEHLVHKPLQKYNKLKPWQLDATRNYLSKLLREQDSLKIIEEIESNQWDINLIFPGLDKSFVDMVASFDNVPILSYLIEKGGDYSGSILHCISYQSYCEESIKYLVSQGASIDTFDFRGKTPLCNAIINYAEALSKSQYYENRDCQRLKEIKRGFNVQKRKIQFFILLGANPRKLDEDGNDYKAILRKRWNENFLVSNKIFSKIEKLVYPDKQGINKWRFWENWSW